MSWSTVKLEIGDVVIDVPKALSLSQSYEPIGGVNRMRTGSGRIVTQVYWTRLKTTLSGEGQISPAFWGVDWTSPQVMKCASPLSIESVSESCTLPAARRSDVAVVAYAWVDGFPVLVPVTVVVDTASVAPVVGSDRYTFEYWPELTVAMSNPQSTHDRSNGKFSWTIVAEEI